MRSAIYTRVSLSSSRRAHEGFKAESRPRLLYEALSAARRRRLMEIIEAVAIRGRVSGVSGIHTKIVIGVEFSESGRPRLISSTGGYLARCCKYDAAVRLSVD